MVKIKKDETFTPRKIKVVLQEQLRGTAKKGPELIKFLDEDDAAPILEQVEKCLSYSEKHVVKDKKTVQRLILKRG